MPSSHPSLEGLREAIQKAVEALVAEPPGTPPRSGIDVVLEVAADYLRTHGVGWFGEGLVPVDWSTVDVPSVPPKTVARYRLVPVPDVLGWSTLPGTEGGEPDCGTARSQQGRRSTGRPSEAGEE